MIDKRLLPARKAVAALHLKSKVEADSFVEGIAMEIAVPLLNLTTTADPRARLATQLLCGEAFTVYDEISDMGLSWGQAADGYVGYVASEGLAARAKGAQARVTASAALVFAAPELKAQQLGAYTFGSQLRLEDAGAYYRVGEGMFIPKSAVAPLETVDFVTVAERFIGAPYLWGGRSFYGLDCSALVQLSLQAVGRDVLRDSDMQLALGGAIDTPSKRGDLVFWAGHVGIMQDATTLLHANAHHMAVVSEPLADAVARIAAGGGGDITTVRRI